MKIVWTEKENGAWVGIADFIKYHISITIDPEPRKKKFQEIHDERIAIIAKNNQYVKTPRVENKRIRQLANLAECYLNIRKEPCKKCGWLIVDGYNCPECGRDPTVGDL